MTAVHPDSTATIVAGTDAAICVVIPVGAVDELLEPQLRAVLAQEVDAPFTVVVSVNTSDPAACRAVDAVVARLGDPRVSVVSSAELRSAAHARNVGLRAAPAGAGLIAFCDADDLVTDGWLAALVAALADHAAVGGHLDDEFPDPRQTAWRPPATPGALPSFLDVPYIVTANMIVRRDAFEAVGGFDTSLIRCEDIAFSWALLKAGHRIGFAPEAVVRYRHRPGLWPLLRQHELYGRGMAQVLARYGVPRGEGSESWHAPSGLAMLRPNGQRATRRSVVGTARRGALAVGRVRGIVDERRTAPHPLAGDREGPRARAAVIGCGAISKEHLHVLGNHPRIELVGVCDRSPAAARWTAERYGTTAYTDHRALLAEARPDVVHVLTPPASHLTIALDALRAGAHVIVEKPIASSSDELRSMLGVAREHDRLCIENHNYRCNDGVLAIDDLLVREVLGEVVAVDVLLALDISTSKFAEAGNPTAHLAGGAVRDFLTHLTYLAMHPFGDADVGEVDARWWNRSGNEHIGADEVTARIDCGTGVATLRFSSRIAPDAFRIWVRGTRGSVETDLFQPFLRVETQRSPKALSSVLNHGLNGVSLATAGGRNLRDKILQRTPYHGLWTLLERFYASVLDGTPPPVTAAQVLRTNEVIDRIVERAGAR